MKTMKALGINQGDVAAYELMAFFIGVKLITSEDEHKRIVELVSAMAADVNDIECHEREFLASALKFLEAEGASKKESHW